MKYTIELTNKQKAQMDCIIDIVHRYVGFNPKLEPIENLWESELEKHRKQAYNSAINDYNAMYEWLHDCVADFKKFLLVKGFYTDEKFLDGFVVGQLMYDLICDHDIAEVIREFQKWQEEKKKSEDEIGVGDEVYILDPNEKSVVTFVDKENRMLVILTIRGKYATLRVSDAHKTGRHFDEVEQIIDKLRCEEK